MSEKKNVTTFRLQTLQGLALEGPILSPYKTQVAETLTHVHDILVREGALLIYAKQWTYVTQAAIQSIQRGQQRFSLPWPLTDEVHPPA